MEVDGAADPEGASVGADARMWATIAARLKEALGLTRKKESYQALGASQACLADYKNPALPKWETPRNARI